MTTPAEPATTNSAASPAERPFQFRVVHLLVAITVAGVFLAAIVPAFRLARRRALQETCRNNLRQLAIGLHNYHDIYLKFPAAYQCDPSGRPAHSWRVAIWNLIEAQPHFSKYNFAEPWNGPNNSKLAAHMSAVYRCPDDNTSPPLMTNYVAVVGPGTMWPGEGSTSISNLTDGTSNTLMIVEIAHSDIHWMEPRDLPVEELAAWLDPNHRPQLLGNHIEGGLVAYADGHVELLPRDLTIQRLKALVTAAGNDVQEGMEAPGR